MGTPTGGAGGLGCLPNHWPSVGATTLPADSEIDKPFAGSITPGITDHPEGARTPSIADCSETSGYGKDYWDCESKSDFSTCPTSPEVSGTPTQLLGVRLHDPYTIDRILGSTYFQLLFESFVAQNFVRGGNPESHGAGSTSEAPDRPTLPPELPKKGAKRPKTNGSGAPEDDGDDDDDDDDDDDKGPPKRPRIDEPPRRLVCPFFAYNSRFFKEKQSCSGNGFSNTHRMK